jgi:hypothetical protein
MKKLFFLSIVLFSQLYAQAQNAIIPKIGIAVTSVDRNPELGSKSSRSGLVVGLAYDASVNELFSLQPELLYIQKGDHREAPGVEVNTRINYLEVPLLAKVKLGFDALKLYAVAGPSVGVGLNGETEARSLWMSGASDVEFGNEEGELKRVDIGLQAGGGIGYQVGKGTLLLDLRYGAGLSNLDNVEDWKFKNRAFTLSVGYAISF